LKEKVEAGKIICPYSHFHIEETLLLKDEKLYEEHKKLWFELSRGYYFVDFRDIKNNYLWFYTRKWLENKKFNSEEDLINEFRGKNKGKYLRQLSFVKNNHKTKEEIYEERQYFSKLNPFLSKKWEKEKDIDFIKMYKDEIKFFIDIILLYSLNIPFIKRFLRFYGLYFPSIIEYKNIIKRALSYGRETEIAEIKQDFLDFLVFKNIEKIPFVKIGCFLNAAKAKKIAHGTKKFKISFENDVDIVAIHLPLVDAMFIDNEMRGLLSENQKDVDISIYGTKLFSKKNNKDFLNYLGKL